MRTLDIMRSLILTGRKTPVIRNLAVQLVQGFPQKAYLSEVSALQKFVRDNVRYVRDIRGVETLHTADKVLQQGAGDCDDKTILACSLVEAIGHKTRLMALAQFGGPFTHVVGQAKIGDQWYFLECTEPVDIYWKPDNVSAIAVKAV